MSPFARLSTAGFAATAVTYGPARMGFGLFLPQLDKTFDLSRQTAGMISSLGFSGFFLGLLVAGALTRSYGPRLPVLCGLTLAAMGMSVIAAAPSLPVLATGVFLAMASAGFSWTPFNNAVHSRVEEAARADALSIVSTGTSVGIVTAGAAVLAMSAVGVSWRICWAAFGAAAALAGAVNLVALRVAARDPKPEACEHWPILFRKRVAPLLAAGLCFGMTSAIYISFASDFITHSGGVPGLSVGVSGGLVFICYGACGFMGLATGRAKRATGLAGLLRLLFLLCSASMAFAALAPGRWTGIVLSAGLQGVYVMMMSAALAFWSDSLFPHKPSQSFTFVLLAVAAGSILGPAGAGFVYQSVGGAAMFAGTGVLSGLAAVAMSAKAIREHPDPL